jgi:uncharacterized membrane protein
MEGWPLNVSLFRFYFFYIYTYNIIYEQLINIITFI